MPHTRLSPRLKEGSFYLILALLLPIVFFVYCLLIEQFSSAPQFIGMENYIGLFLEDEVFRRAFFNTFIFPICLLIPSACLSLWLAKRLVFLPDRRQFLVGGIAFGAAVLIVSAGFLLNWHGREMDLLITAYILTGLGGGLLFLPARLLGAKLGRYHGVFLPLIQLTAACMAAEFFYLSIFLRTVRENLLHFDWGTSALVPFGGIFVMLYLSVLLCLLLWCFSSLYQFIAHRKSSVST